MNGQDVLLSLDSSEAHRVISFAASQSLHVDTLGQRRVHAISTGLPRLDEAICASPVDGATGEQECKSQRPKGTQQGHITEIFGPPGVGKTCLALKVASNALHAGGKVVWIDTGCPLPRQRLKEILLSSIAPETNTTSNLPFSQPPCRGTENTPSQNEGYLTSLTNKFIYFRASSLPHLLALIFRSPNSFPPDGTVLLVIDSISGPFSSYFPNPSDLKSRFVQGNITNKAQLQWHLNRKWNVASDMVTHLAKLAARHQMAVLMVNQTHTKIKGEPRATLYPALAGGSDWEASIYSRIVMYRDLLPPNNEFDDNSGGVPQSLNIEVGSGWRKARFAEVLKRAGKTLTIRLAESIVPFTIETAGLREIYTFRPQLSQMPVIPAADTGSLQKQDNDRQATLQSDRKRKVDVIADSEDEDDSEEDFDWVNDSNFDGGLPEEASRQR